MTPDYRKKPTRIDTTAIRAAFSEKPRTHYDGCELVYPRCAVSSLCDEVDRLRAVLKRCSECGLLCMVCRAKVAEVLGESK